MPPSPKPLLSLSPPKLYAIVDADVCAAAGRAAVDVARAFLSGGARWLQLRCKGMPSGPFLDLANDIMDASTAAGATLIVNDRADVTRLCGAHGLHIGQSDLSPADARSVIGSTVILGLSTHTREQWETAVRQPISYLAIGPAFSTGTKHTGYEAVGLEAIARASSSASAAGLPTIAIGGITIDNAASVIEAGAASVAVISDLVKGDPEERCRAFIQALQ